MDWLRPIVECSIAAGCGIGLGILLARQFARRTSRKLRRRSRRDGRKLIRSLLQSHFHPADLESTMIFERKFPFRVRADLQRAIDRLFLDKTKVSHFCGVQKEDSYEGLNFSRLMVDGHSPAVSVPPQYEEVDVGEDQPVRCLKNGLWFLENEATKHAVFLSPAGSFGRITGIQFQIATPNDKGGTAIAEAFFKHLEECVLKSESYRGKVLSLEASDHGYSGESNGITVHRLRNVSRDRLSCLGRPWNF